jgi:hypothetical protein
MPLGHGVRRPVGHWDGQHHAVVGACSGRRRPEARLHVRHVIAGGLDDHVDRRVDQPGQRVELRVSDVVGDGGTARPVDGEGSHPSDGEVLLHILAVLAPGEVPPGRARLDDARVDQTQPLLVHELQETTMARRVDAEGQVRMLDVLTRGSLTPPALAST